MRQRYDDTCSSRSARVNALSHSGQWLRVEADWMMKKGPQRGTSLSRLQVLIVALQTTRHLQPLNQNPHRRFLDPRYFRLYQPPVGGVRSSLSRPAASQWYMKALVEGVNLAGSVILRQDPSVSNQAESAILSSEQCDRARPQCENCVKFQQPCPGYKDDFDVMWKDQNALVPEKARRQRVERAKKKAVGGWWSKSQTSPGAGEPTNRTQRRLARSHQVYHPTQSSNASVSSSPTMST